MPSSKAKNLQILKDAGFNVPNFEVIKSEDIQNNSYEISLKANKYAVRSAANIEDGSDNSFAGQFATYLNVTEKDLKTKIKSCANAIANSKSYSENKHIDTKNLKVDVIVQEMVDADFAGVGNLFQRGNDFIIICVTEIVSSRFADFLQRIDDNQPRIRHLFQEPRDLFIESFAELHGHDGKVKIVRSFHTEHLVKPPL